MKMIENFGLISKDFLEIVLVFFVCVVEDLKMLLVFNEYGFLKKFELFEIYKFSGVDLDCCIIFINFFEVVGGSNFFGISIEVFENLNDFVIKSCLEMSVFIFEKVVENEFLIFNLDDLKCVFDFEEVKDVVGVRF